MRNAQKILVWKTEGKKHSEDLDIDGKTILELTLEKMGGRCGLDSSGTGQGKVVGSCEHDNEDWGSTKGGEFIV
jgi:hypothetical protein